MNFIPIAYKTAEIKMFEDKYGNPDRFTITQRQF